MHDPTEPYPLNEASGPGVDGDDDLETTQLLGRVPLSPVEAGRIGAANPAHCPGCGCQLPETGPCQIPTCDWGMPA